MLDNVDGRYVLCAGCQRPVATLLQRRDQGVRASVIAHCLPCQRVYRVIQRGDQVQIAEITATSSTRLKTRRRRRRRYRVRLSGHARHRRTPPS